MCFWLFWNCYGWWLLNTTPVETTSSARHCTSFWSCRGPLYFFGMFDKIKKKNQSGIAALVLWAWFPEENLKPQLTPHLANYFQQSCWACTQPLWVVFSEMPSIKSVFLGNIPNYPPRLMFWNPYWIFTESAPRPVIELRCPSVCLFVCLSMRAIEKLPLPEVVETSGRRTYSQYGNMFKLLSMLISLKEKKEIAWTLL